jgi:hypothetical protein
MLADCLSPHWRGSFLQSVCHVTWFAYLSLFYSEALLQHAHVFARHSAVRYFYIFVHSASRRLCMYRKPVEVQCCGKGCMATADDHDTNNHGPCWLRTHSCHDYEHDQSRSYSMSCKSITTQCICCSYGYVRTGLLSHYRASTRPAVQAQSCTLRPSSGSMCSSLLPVPRIVQGGLRDIGRPSREGVLIVVVTSICLNNTDSLLHPALVGS